MGLRDWFKRKPVEPPTLPRELLELWGTVGAQGATLETVQSRLEGLKDEWLTLRDELRKLAQRLEKRDQRAEQRAAEVEEPKGFDPLEAERALAQRRKGNAILRGR